MHIYIYNNILAALTVWKLNSDTFNKALGRKIHTAELHGYILL